MHLLKKLIISLLVGVVTFVAIIFLVWQLLIWLFPPIIIVGGQMRHTMPLGHAIYSMLAGSITALIAFVITFWKIKK